MGSYMQFTHGEQVRIRLLGGDLISGTVDAFNHEMIWLHPDWAPPAPSVKVRLDRVGSIARPDR